MVEMISVFMALLAGCTPSSKLVQRCHGFEIALLTQINLNYATNERLRDPIQRAASLCQSTMLTEDGARGSFDLNRSAKPLSSYMRFDVWTRNSGV
jgi:hypothetical protein